MLPEFVSSCTGSTEATDSLEMSDMVTEPPAAPFFVPPDAGSTHCVAFLKKVNEKYGLALDSYFDLYKWSIDHIDLFWDTVWDDVVIVGYKGQDIVDNNAVTATNPPWFSEARINWAENMLTCRSADKLALIQASMLINCPLICTIIRFMTDQLSPPPSALILLIVASHMQISMQWLPIRFQPC
jgi:hypothetical protein